MNMIEYSNGERVTVDQFRKEHKNVLFGVVPSKGFLTSIGAKLVSVKDETFSANEIRQRRNTLLSESDWTQVADAPVDQAGWATYRQALRDITTQEGFPNLVTWPDKPK